jgi:hypothetical protein
MTQKQKIERLEQYLAVQEEANKILKEKNEYLQKELENLKPQKYLDTEIENFFNSNIGETIKNYFINVIHDEIDIKLEKFEKYLDEKVYLLRIGEDA